MHGMNVKKNQKAQVLNNALFLGTLYKVQHIINCYRII